MNALISRPINTQCSMLSMGICSRQRQLAIVYGRNFQNFRYSSLQSQRESESSSVQSPAASVQPAKEFMLDTASKINTLINRITGHDRIETLKADVYSKEHQLLQARQNLLEAKKQYDEAVSSRSHHQRELNSLLQRKHAWTDADVVRFTELFRQEHTLTQTEAAAKDNRINAERQTEDKYDQLIDTIRARYHEEQLWSDKMRTASTYGTLVLMMTQLVMFMGVQLWVEPWKRERLVERVERLITNEVKGKDEGVNEALQQMQTNVDTAVTILNDLSSKLPPPPTDIPIELKKQDQTWTWDRVFVEAAIGSVLVTFLINLYR